MDIMKTQTEGVMKRVTRQRVMAPSKGVDNERIRRNRAPQALGVASVAGDE